MVTEVAARGRRRDMGRPPGRNDSRRPARSDPRREFAELLLAALTGRRSAASVIRLVSSEVYEQLWTTAEEGGLRRAGGPGWRVVACRHCAPAPGVLEVCATVSDARRTRALAFRLESGPGRRWRCTALETG